MTTVLDEYKGFTVIDVDGYIHLRHDNQNIDYNVCNMSFATESEAKEYVDIFFDKEDKLSSVKQQRQYKSKSVKTMDSDYNDYVYVVTDGRRFAGRNNSLVLFNDPNMIIFLDRQVALDSAKHHKTPMQVKRVRFYKGKAHF